MSGLRIPICPLVLLLLCAGLQACTTPDFGDSEAGQAQLFLIDGLAHVDFRPKAQDVPQLLAAMQALLDMRKPCRE